MKIANLILEQIWNDEQNEIMYAQHQDEQRSELNADMKREMYEEALSYE